MTLEEFLAIPTLTPVPEGWEWTAVDSAPVFQEFKLTNGWGRSMYHLWQAGGRWWANRDIIRGIEMRSMAEAKQWCHIMAEMGL